MNPRRVLLLAAAVALCVQGVGLATSQATPVNTVLCDHNQHMLVGKRGATPAYQIRNPYWRGSGEQCIRSNGGAGFRVTRVPAPDHAGRVVGYPDIYRGCIWNVCTPDGALPKRVSAIQHAASTWHTIQGAPGTWNAAYDIWFGKHRMTQGHADGAELMIWLNHHGACCFKPAGSPQVRIQGRLFWLIHWRAYDDGYGGVAWNYIQFRAVHRVWHVDRLGLRPFIARCERLGLIRPSWWMENVEAGFEIWSGGRGLATTNFRVSVR